MDAKGTKKKNLNSIGVKVGEMISLILLVILGLKAVFEISGSYKNQDGVFEYIIEPDNTINHRFLGY